MSARIPDDYSQMRAWAAALLDPLMALAEPGHAGLPLIGPPSDHGDDADRLESFARPLLLAAQLLASCPEGTPEDDARRERAARWFREGLVAGTDPAGPHFWGWAAHHHQHTVEQGLMTIGLRFGAEHLWEPLAAEERAQVLRWLSSARGVGHVRNNHLFFDILVLEFLGWAGAGEPGDEAAIEHDFAELEAMYRGQGWFIDGLNETFDPYNAFAFHYYAPLWNHFYGTRDRDRVARWRSWTDLFLVGYESWFAASGETPAYGRSLAYRFNGVAAYGAALLDDGGPLAPGRTRSLVMRHIGFFLDRSIRQGQGALSLGWTDTFPDLREPYSCAGSPYWAAKAFAPLLLPPEHGFWTEPAEPAGAARGDSVTVLSPAGFVARAVGGEVDLLSAASAINPGNLHRYGAWKWGRLSYHTRFGFTLGTLGGDYPIDGGLTARCDGQQHRAGRHWTIPLDLTDERMQVLYVLGDKNAQTNVRVRSTIRWNGPWQLHIHAIDPFTPAELTLGGQPLPLAAGEAPVVTLCTDGAAAASAELATVVQGLTGWDHAGIEHAVGKRDGRRHIMSPDHATPWLATARLTGPAVLVALVYAGPAPAPAPWQVDSFAPGRLVLNRPDGTIWTIDDPELST